MRLFAFLARAASDGLCLSCICFAASGEKRARIGKNKWVAVRDMDLVTVFKDAWGLPFGDPEHREVPPWMDGGSFLVAHLLCGYLLSCLSIWRG